MNRPVTLDALNSPAVQMLEEKLRNYKRDENRYRIAALVVKWLIYIFGPLFIAYSKMNDDIELVDMIKKYVIFVLINGFMLVVLYEFAVKAETLSYERNFVIRELKERLPPGVELVITDEGKVSLVEQ